MFSVVSFVIGMLAAWFLEWLYVYFTKSKPRKNAIKQLEATVQENEQAHATETARLNGEIAALQAQLEKLTNEYEVVAAEADGLRGELDTIQRPVADAQDDQDAAHEHPASGALDDDTLLEQEFAAAMDLSPEPADDPVAPAAEAEAVAVADPAVTADDTAVAADDLTRLTGIGPKTAELLNQSGVISFAQLAAMSTEALHTFLQDNNIPHSKAKVANWPQQAAQMAAAEQ